MPLSQLKESMRDLPSLIVRSRDDLFLIFTAPPDRAYDIEEISDLIALKISKIGTMVEDKTVRVIDGLGHNIKLQDKGFHHF